MLEHQILRLIELQLKSLSQYFSLGRLIETAHSELLHYNRRLNQL